jgi:hypothetical protein
LNFVPHNDILNLMPHNGILNPVPHNGLDGQLKGGTVGHMGGFSVNSMALAIHGWSRGFRNQFLWLAPRLEPKWQNYGWLYNILRTFTFPAVHKATCG